MSIIFRDKRHEELFKKICIKMKYRDEWHLPVAYLLSLDAVCRNHINELFYFEEDIVKHSGLNRPWQTDTSRKTTRLMFNLWNNYCSDDDGSAKYYDVADIFSCDYAPYYWEAIKLRFPHYTNFVHK